MGDDKGVRFVRCPKCENVLPELPDYSVYRCGGCNAVLRAKARNPEVDSFSDKSDEGRAAVVVESFENYPDKGTVTKNDTAEKNVLSSSSSFRRDQRPLDTEEKCKNASALTVDEWVFENDFDANAAGSDLGISDLEKEVLELKSRVQNASGSQRSPAENGNTVGVELHKASRTDVEGVRFSTSNLNNMNEGSSNSRFRTVYSCENGDGDVINRVERVNQDKAELLKKLNEIKDQLTQSCSVSGKPKESVPQDPWFQEVSSGLGRPCRALDKRVMDPPYINQYPDHYPILNRPEISAAHGCFYPAVHTSNRCPVYGDPCGPHMLTPAPKALPYHYQQPSHSGFSRQYIDTELDPYAPYSNNGALHQPSCSCLHCCGKHQELPGSTATATFCNQTFPDVSIDSVFYNHENSAAFGPPRGYNPTSASMNPPSLLKSQNPPSRWSSDVNIEMGGFAHLHPQTMAVANSRRRCHPMAGGAPFVTCPKCFELLQIPIKVLLMEQTHRKMQCGVCSAVIDFATVNKKIVVVATKQAPSDVDACSTEGQKGTSHACGRLNNRGSMNFYSDDSSYDLQSVDREPVSSSTIHDFQSINSSSLSTSEEECIDGLAGQKDITESTELPVKGTSSPRLPPGSPLQQHFDYSSNNQRFGKGNRSTRSDQEVMASNKATSRQNSLKDLTMAAEVDVSFNEFSNNGTSQGSADVSREEDQSRTNKGSDSFFAGIIKKSFRDFSRSNHTAERGKTSVAINGHPITDRMVKKAEKLAGPIHSGKYWYDSRAGFWGVMGGPGLGIIPPFIEEFNYPMPANCASGNTNVFVNGRELHQKDLDLLASRGLPTDADRSYIIEISGRVLDEDSGEELDSLGKLAPTVEKVKHGFGMKLPRSAAA